MSTESPVSVIEAVPARVVSGVMLEPGHRLGHYEIIELIGKGGMGEVYRARGVRVVNAWLEHERIVTKVLDRFTDVLELSRLVEPVRPELAVLLVMNPGGVHEDVLQRDRGSFLR